MPGYGHPYMENLAAFSTETPATSSRAPWCASGMVSHGVQVSTALESRANFINNMLALKPFYKPYMTNFY